MSKKGRLKGLEKLLSPLILRLNNEYDLSKIESSEVNAIKSVEASDDMLLVVSRWEAGLKPWQMTSMKNTSGELEELAWEMVNATGRDAFWVHLYDAEGNAWNLKGETVKVKYDLEEI
jgi:hypothetical protein